MEFLWFLVALLAAAAGAVSGFGGGFIIKPVMDAAGVYDARTVSVLSSVTVLAMAAATTVRYRLAKVPYGRHVLFLSAGAAAGGYLGNLAFSAFSRVFCDPLVKSVQAGLLILLLAAVLFQDRFRRFEIKRPLPVVSAGAALGLVSSFLGIGGGPFNVVVLCVLFSVGMRDAAVYSIFIILCSQAVSVASKAAGGEVSAAHLHVLLFMVPAAVAGGLLGAALNRRMSETAAKRLFDVTVALMLALNAWIMISQITRFVRPK